MPTRTQIYLALALSLAGIGPAGAQSLDFTTPDAPTELADQLRSVSLTRQALAKTPPTAQDIFTAANADYARLLSALYEEGYYSGRISILINGREAGAIAPMDAPDQISSVQITIHSGSRFRLGRAEIGPLAKDTALPPTFAKGEVARVGVIKEAAEAGISAWRDDAYAKAEIADQAITADHKTRNLDVALRIAPGPKLRFGTMSVKGNDRLSTQRLQKIAGFPEGEWFSPDKLDTVRKRLRRTGIFSAVSLQESETISAGNTLDASLQVTEAPLRRLGFGAEISSLDGLNLSGYWLHRNLLGGGERFRVDAEINGIGGATGGEDYSLGTRIDRPATLSPDTTAYIETELFRRNEEDYTDTGYSLAIGFAHIVNDNLTGTVAAAYTRSRIRDDAGETIYKSLALPVGLTWDNRDDPMNPRMGYYGDVTLTPFYGFGTTGSGARLAGDLRAYRSLDADKRLTIAGRLQFGEIYGSDLAETPRDYLFYSGGGGTVRGQPYQSLGVSILNGGTLHTGGSRFLGLSGELRGDISDRFGLVGFYDLGYIAAESGTGTVDDWHAGAGLGLRYQTGIGPIRLDVAGPVGGDTGEGIQLYVGIGQAF